MKTILKEVKENYQMIIPATAVILYILTAIVLATLEQIQILTL